MAQLTPRLRRLDSDYRTLQELARQSPVFQFQVGQRGELDLPESYLLEFRGPSLVRGSSDLEKPITIRWDHQVQLTLGPHYPRMLPGLHWITPIFHPNVSSGGTVCLGGYSTHWVPSLMLDQLCSMLWDMLTYRNYDLASPYNTEAANWLSIQSIYSLPLSAFPLHAARLVHRIEPSKPTSSFDHEIVFLDEPSS